MDVCKDKNFVRLHAFSLDGDEGLNGEGIYDSYVSKVNFYLPLGGIVSRAHLIRELLVRFENVQVAGDFNITHSRVGSSRCRISALNTMPPKR